MSRQIVLETLNINILILLSVALDKTLTVSQSFEVLTVKQSISVFGDVTLCCYLSDSRHFEGVFCLSSQGSSGPGRIFL